MLNIVHITTHLGGGAGIACLRLHRSLLAQGVNSRIVTLFYNGNDERIYGVIKNKLIFNLYKILKNFPLPFGSFLNLKFKEKKLGGTYEIFSNQYSLFHIENLTVIKKADVINLHWVAELVNYPTFFKNINKPIIWTLHDLNPLSGGFHYKEDQKLNPQLKNLDSKIKSEKSEILQAYSNLAFACPSSWMKNETSKVFPDKKSVVAFNPIIPEEFEKKPSKDIEKKLLRDKHRKRVLFISESVSNRRKGFQHLLSALKKIKNKNLELTVVGKNTSQEGTGKLGLSFNFLGPIHSPADLGYVLRECDLFVIPSREDNLPNVVVESLISGCPVISFKVGGLPDLITPGENGYMAEPFEEDQLAEMIERASSLPFDREAISVSAKHKFSSQNQTEIYINLYKEAVAHASHS